MINMLWSPKKMRVETRAGNNNVLLIAPHGHSLDDTFTDVVTREMANELHCYYVLNHGWKRDLAANPLLGIANCNDIDHCQVAEVSSSFLDPINTYTKEIIQKYGVAQVLFIHGMSDVIHHRVPNLDAVIGYGEGKKPRYICSQWRKDLLIDKMIGQGWFVYEGAPGGKFSAYSKTNLAQAICNGKNIQGLQIEIVETRRTSEAKATDTARQLAKAVEEAREFIRRNHKNPTRYKNYTRVYAVNQI